MFKFKDKHHTLVRHIITLDNKNVTFAFNSLKEKKQSLFTNSFSIQSLNNIIRPIWCNMQVNRSLKIPFDIILRNSMCFSNNISPGWTRTLCVFFLFLFFIHFVSLNWNLVDVFSSLACHQYIYIICHPFLGGHHMLN